jgi:pimeloyl-ACP methyl ester carboxylesterase
VKLIRFDDWTNPVRPVRREVISRRPEEASDLPPVLFVPGRRYGVDAFAEHWLPHTAGRGFAAHALTPRERGDLRAHVHDVIQTAAALPRRAVLVGHGTGAIVVAHALERYPARAAVLAAPAESGWLPRVGGWLAGISGRLPGRGSELPRPAGDPPVLVVGSPDDRVVPRKSLDRVAAHFGGAPLLFPGMGHDLMLAGAWSEPIDAILDWLTKQSAPAGHPLR